MVRRHFAEIGDIKTFFDLVEKRAMAFVTYVSSPVATGLNRVVPPPVADRICSFGGSTIRERR